MYKSPKITTHTHTYLIHYVSLHIDVQHAHTTDRYHECKNRLKKKMRLGKTKIGHDNHIDTSSRQIAKFDIPWLGLHYIQNFV